MKIFLWDLTEMPVESERKLSRKGRTFTVYTSLSHCTTKYNNTPLYPRISLKIFPLRVSKTPSFSVLEFICSASIPNKQISSTVVVQHPVLHIHCHFGMSYLEVRPAGSTPIPLKHPSPKRKKQGQEN